MRELLVGVWQKHLETQSDRIQINVGQIVCIAGCEHTIIGLTENDGHEIDGPSVQA